MRHPEGTLIIDKSESFCGDCGRYALYTELTHDSAFAQGEGCGVAWEYVTSNYFGLGIGKFAAQARPDLKWIGDDDYVYWYEGQRKED